MARNAKALPYLHDVLLMSSPSKSNIERSCHYAGLPVVTDPVVPQPAKRDFTAILAIKELKAGPPGKSRHKTCQKFEF